MDMERLKNKLKNKKKLAVTKNGQLRASDPHNDGRREGETTLEPQGYAKQ